MKKLSKQRFFGTITLLLLAVLFSKAQVNFTLSSTTCAGSSQTLSLISGSISALSNTWAALPAGPVFSAPNSTITLVSFPAAGTFTIAIGVISSSGLSFFTNTITVQSAPSLTVSQNSLTTCIESNSPSFSKPVLLNALGANNYTWYPIQSPPQTPGNGSQIAVRPSATSCYTVVGNTLGCESSASICVIVIPQFSIDVSPQPAVRCIPDSLKLSIINIQSTAVGPISAWTYSWTESNTSTVVTLSSYFSSTVLVFPTSSNSYTAEMRDSRDCVSLPKTVSVSVQSCTGIKKETTEHPGVKIFPNPSKGIINLESDSDNEIIILNAIGQIVYSSKFGSGLHRINLEYLAKGVYMVKVSNGKSSTTFKMIKE